MKYSIILFFSFSCLFFFAFANQNSQEEVSADPTGPWKILNNHLATILMGVSFVDAQKGWVSGAQNGLGPIILKTTNGGKNWTNNEHGIQSMFFMDIAMADSTHGICSGLGLGRKIDGTVYTTDGTTWQLSDTETSFEAFQSVGAIDDLTVWQVGSWASIKHGVGEGVMISSDAGKTFVEKNWSVNTTARYGSFLDAQTGWISGGLWPETKHSRFNVIDRIRRLSRSQWISIEPITGHLKIRSHEEVYNNLRIGGGYQAGIAKTTNGGNTWTTQFSNLDSWYYFNQIWFASPQKGWVVGEGTNATTRGPAAWIWATTDGGETWQQQLYLEGGSLLGIEMISETEGFACGAIIDPKMVGKFYHTTDGGKTWSDEGSSLPNLYPLNLDIIDSKTGFAVAAGSLGVCSTLVYSP